MVGVARRANGRILFNTLHIVSSVRSSLLYAALVILVSKAPIISLSSHDRAYSRPSTSLLKTIIVSNSDYGNFCVKNVVLGK